MKRRDNNGLGIGILVLIIAVTPLVPAAMSVNPPQWVWDENGKVSDASGQFRSLSDEEACEMYGICKKPLTRSIGSSASSSGSDPGSGGSTDDGGGGSGGC